MCPECTVAIATAEGGQQVTVNTTDYTKLTSLLTSLMDQWEVVFKDRPIMLIFTYYAMLQCS